MNAPTRLAAFAVLLALTFGGSMLAGSAIDPTDDPPVTHDRGHSDGRDATSHPGDPGSTGHDGGDHPADRPAPASAPR